MGLIGGIFSTLFGGGNGKNVVKETIEVFRPNAEASAQRSADYDRATLQQFAAEFAAQSKTGWWDRFIDGLNRLPRPLMTFGVLGLFVAAMVDPIWFNQRMVGLLMVPDELWYLMGAIVTFYFGARTLEKSSSFERRVIETAGKTDAVLRKRKELEELREPDLEEVAEPEIVEPEIEEDTPVAPHLPDEDDNAILPLDVRGNPALSEWVRRYGDAA